MASLKRNFSILLLLFFLLSLQNILSGKILGPDEAFKLSAQKLNNAAIEAKWEIAEGYQLYKNEISILLAGNNGTILGKIEYPKGIIAHSEALGEYEYYKGILILTIPVSKWGIGNTEFVFNYQGCKENSFCYPPQTKVISISPPRQSNKSSIISPTLSSAQKLLESGSVILILSTFFIFGVFLSLTPCVLPMIPILAGIIIGQKEVKTSKAFFLSLSYVLGMAITYSIAGIITAILGSSIQAILQNFWVILFCALIFVLLALSLFGVYELKLPSSLMNKLNIASQNTKKGTYIGVFLMGVISSLIVSPCVSAPLAGALIYIASTGNIFLGGSALFFLALGMGVILIAVGVTGGKLFIKTGRWMIAVRYLLGIIMLAMAVWLVSRAIPQIFQQSVSIDKNSILTLVTTPAEMQKLIEMAAAEEKFVMIDYYADWCISCKELDKMTFKNPNVQNALKNFALIKADITKNNADSEEMKAKYKVFAPPYIVFLDSKGNLISEASIAGFIKPEAFLKHLKALNQPPYNGN